MRFKRINTKSLLWVILIAAVVPFYLLSVYNEPSSDDFKYAANSREYGALQRGAWMYFATSGRYAANVFLHCSPLAIGWLEGYKWLGVILLTALIGSFYYLLSPNLKGMPGAAKALAVLAFVALFLFGLPSVCQGLFWFSGAYTYTTAIVLLNIFFGLLLRRRNFTLQEPRWDIGTVCSEVVLLAGGVLLLGLAFGCTEIAVIYTGIILLLLNAYVWFGLKRFDAVLFAVSLAGLAFAALAILAPGNFARSDTYELAKDAQRTLMLTPAYCVWFLGSFASVPLLVAMLLLAPRIGSASFRVSPAICQGWVRVLVVLLFFGLMALTFAFGIWATGNRPARRALNVLYWVQFLLLAIAFLQSATADAAWWSRVRRLLPVSNAALLAIGLGWLVLLGNPGRAWGDLFLRCPGYAKQIEARRSATAAARGGDAVVKPIDNKPLSIFFEDITHDPAYWQNVEMARYFGVQSIRLSDKDVNHPSRE